MYGDTVCAVKKHSCYMLTCVCLHIYIYINSGFGLGRVVREGKLVRYGHPILNYGI